MTLEDRLKNISEASGLSEEEIREALEKKKEDAAGLLTDLGAVYALEKEYGVTGNSSPSIEECTAISELKKNMSNVSVVGAIKEIRPIKKFTTPKRSGQVARIVLVDSTGEVHVILWDKNAEIAASDKLSLGKILHVRNAYTKESLNGEPEVHVGGLSRIIIDPKTSGDLDIPEILENVKKTSELEEGEIVSVHGKILYAYPKSEFQRNDGKTGQRASLILADDAGKTRAVLWDAAADLMERFNEGDIVKLENAQVRTGERGSELHIGSRGRMIPSDAQINVEEYHDGSEKSLKIAEVTPESGNFSVAARLMRILPPREFEANGRTGKLLPLILVDETGITRAVLWNEKADIAKDLTQGDIVLIKNAYSKQNMNGEAEIHLSSRGSLQVNPSGIEIGEMPHLIAKHSTEKKISELGPDERNISISGLISDVSESTIMFEVCSECGSRIENVAGEWLCDLCGEASPAYCMVISCTIKDDTGSIRAVFYRDAAEELCGLSVPDALNIIGESGDELEPSRRIKDILLGSEIQISGHIRYNDYQDSLELMVSAISNIKRSSPQEKSIGNDIPDDVAKEVLKDDESPLPDEEIKIEEISLDD